VCREGNAIGILALLEDDDGAHVHIGEPPIPLPQSLEEICLAPTNLDCRGG
jgi:hypothetical protein